MIIDARVFDKTNKVMLEVDTIYLSEGSFKAVGASECEVYPFNTKFYSELMFFTGMTDEVGKKLYSGDWVTNGGAVEFMEIVYQAPCFVMKSHIKKGLSKQWSTFIGHPDNNQFVRKVGNKYE